MDMRITYTNTRGEMIDFGGPGSVYHYGQNGIRDSLWSYDVSNGIVTFCLGERETEFPVHIWAPDETAGIAARNKLADVCETDVLAGEPGALRIGEWSLRCYVIGSASDAWWYDDRVMAANLTILAPDPVWTREQAQDYVPERGGQTSVLGKDYPHGYPYDYAAQRTVRPYILDARSPAACRITVYGPAKSPYVWIGANRYKVDVDVPAGGLLIIDGRAKTIRLRDIDGNETDAYTARQRGARGSGDYVFERVAPGYNAVSWDGSFGFEVRAYVERSAPEWTI